MRFSSVLILIVVISGCASARSSVLPSPMHTAATSGQGESDSSTTCSHCAPETIDEALMVRSAERVAELKTLGGECAVYAFVLETSLLAGRVTVRPYMWRVEGRLVSGEARPDGAIVVARHIDPLNVGMRNTEDIVRTLEHEAAHVAFRISNGRDAADDRATVLVRGCRTD